MTKSITSLKEFILDFLFPQFCFGCQKEGQYLCEDCEGILEVSGIHQNYYTQNLKDLYFPVNYQNPLIKKIIHKFKYEPFVKELAKPLSSLIIHHFQLLEKVPDFSNFVLIPIPSERKRLKWRGFNQAQELGKELSKLFKIPLISDYLIKIKETLPQVEISDEIRKENVKNAFLVKNKGQIFDKKFLLVDDIYTTGSTMEECARILKMAGAKEIIGIVVARG